METFLTKTMTIVALLCFLVVGAAATAILGRDIVPASSSQVSAVAQPPVSNRESKKDRLAVVSYAQAAYEPPQPTAAPSEPLRQAYAPAAPADIARRMTDLKPPALSMITPEMAGPMNCPVA